MLRSNGFSCDTAESGREGINLILERLDQLYSGGAKMYKLILLDYSMPEMDGPQVARAIREIMSGCILLEEADAPYICCCSAYEADDYKKSALDAGMHDFLTKPAKKEKIRQLLRLLVK